MTRTLPALMALLLTGCLIPGTGAEGDLHYTSLNRVEPLGGEQAVEARLDLPVGQLSIAAGDPGQAYALDLSYDESVFKPDIDYERRGNRGYLDFDLKGQGKVRLHSGKNRLQILFSPSTPLLIHARTGVGKSVLDLSGLRLDELKLEGGVGETRLSMLSPNPVTCQRIRIENGVGELGVIGLGNFQFDELEFRGGVGEASLDFSGQWAVQGKADIRVGIGGIKLRLPSDLGVELSVKKSFLSNVDLDGFEQKGRRYLSHNFDEASKKMQLNISAGIGAVEIEWL